MQSTILKSLFHNSKWAFWGQGVTIIVSMAETFLLARFLSVETFGGYLVLSATIILLFGVLDSRSGEAVIRFVPLCRNKGGKPLVGALLRFLFEIDLVLAAIAMASLAVVSHSQTSWFSVPEDSLRLLLILGIGSALRGIFNCVGSFLRVIDSFSLSVKVGIVCQMTRLAFLSYALMSRPTLERVCLAVSISEGVWAAALFYACRFKLRAEKTPIFGNKVALNRDIRGELLNFMFGSFLSTSIRTIAKKADTLVIAAVGSIATVALYRVAARIAATVLLLSDPLVSVVYPEMSRLKAQDKLDELMNITRLLTKIFTAISLSLLCLFAWFGQGIIHMLVGENYGGAYLPVLIMLAGTTFSMAFFWVRPLLLVYGLSIHIAGIGLIAVLLQLGSMWLLVPRYGAVGGAAALALYNVVVVFALIVVYRKVSHKEDALKFLPMSTFTTLVELPQI